jgi:endonuclease YncB( thermonuclease family)
VIDGDTVVFTGGKTIKLLGIDATFSGRVNTQLIRQYLSVLLTNKNIWLEYDRYLKDAAGFDLVWVWVGCEGAPKFWAVRGAEDNPVNCKNGALVNEQIIKMGWSRVNLPDKSIGVRYEKRLYAL